MIEVFYYSYLGILVGGGFISIRVFIIIKVRKIGEMVICILFFKDFCLEVIYVIVVFIFLVIVSNTVRFNFK